MREGGGGGPWWRQEEAEKHMKVTLKEILETARERRPREFGRRGRGEIGEEESESGSEG